MGSFWKTNKSLPGLDFPGADREKRAMKAIRFSSVGGPEVLKYEDVELPPPAAGQVRVRHSVIGVNFIDTYHRSGLYKLPLPSGLGSEAAGVVEALGDGVTALKPGDRVAYAGTLGAYAQANNVPADRLVKIPASVSDEAAAAAMLKGMTTQYLLKRTHPVKAGETILFHSAAGGVGLIAGQWAKHLGATVIGVNFIDTYHRSGLYKLPLPTGLGSEAAGVVETVGAEVTTLKVGDRVAYAGTMGAY